jgi:cytochrome P450
MLTTDDLARAEAFSMPLDRIDVAKPRLFADDSVGPSFARLRRDDPVHWTQSPINGGFWSVMRYQDIMAMDTKHRVYSSDWSRGGVGIFDPPPDLRDQMFIAMDPSRHDAQRKAVSPTVAPSKLAQMEALIRERTRTVLDRPPRNQTFDGVDRVSIALTSLMLATLFDFPLEDRRLLTWWSDVSTTPVGDKHMIRSEAQRWDELGRCLAYCTRLWNERVDEPPAADRVSMPAHGPATRDMSPREFRGNLILLIVGGNDPTRNSMTGGLAAISRYPEQGTRLRANPALIDSMVPEIIRWQTPLAHRRRTALEHADLGGKTIRKGDKPVMGYQSGNRDDTAIGNPEAFAIDRPRPRRHLSFGFGIHRCVGNRPTEMQLRILWEEILPRFPVIEVVGPPRCVRSNFVRGYTELPVRIPG